MSKAPKQSEATARSRGLWAYAAVWLIVCLAYTFGVFEFLDRKIQDIRFMANDRAATGDIVVVEIDAWSLTEFNGWPWPRRHFAEAIGNLSAAGAKRVLLDVDFSSYSDYERSNPGRCHSEGEGQSRSPHISAAHVECRQ